MMFKFHKMLLFSAVAGLMLNCSGEPATEKAPLEQEVSQQKPSESLDDLVVLFFGNSLTAAYGLDPDEGFPGLIQARLDSLGWPVQTINAGVTGETTATGRNRVKWVLERQRVDVFVLELGANDGLRGIPTEETQRNLKAIIGTVREIHPEAEIIIAGMMVPPNMGPDYSAEFQAVFPRIAEEENVHLIPFLLEDVAGETDLNLPDGIHPNADGQRIVAETVWKELEPVLRSKLK